MLIEGVSLRNIAEHSGTSPQALLRHKDHIAAALIRAKDVQEVIQADTLLDRLQALNQETRDILKAAKADDDPHLALKAIARAEKQLELEARLLGELNDQTTVNILVAPEWLAVRAAILEALGPFPDARAQVAARLMLLETR